MRERRVFIYLSFVVLILLVLLAGVLIFFNRGGAAQFDVLGQSFSSTNVGLAVLFGAAVMFVYLLKHFAGLFGNEPGRSRIYESSERDGEITWTEMIDGVHELILQLTAADGFKPDLVVGVCGGGLLVADMLCKRLGHIPCLAIWPERHSAKPGARFVEGHAAAVNKIPLNEIVDATLVRRILIVDDVVYGGETLEAAVNFVRSRCKKADEGMVTIKSAALFTLTRSKFKPDFSVFTHSSKRRMMPSSDRLRR